MENKWDFKSSLGREWFVAEFVVVKNGDLLIFMILWSPFLLNEKNIFEEIFHCPRVQSMAKQWFRLHELRNSFPKKTSKKLIITWSSFILIPTSITLINLNLNANAIWNTDQIFKMIDQVFLLICH